MEKVMESHGILASQKCTNPALAKERKLVVCFSTCVAINFPRNFLSPLGLTIQEQNRKNSLLYAITTHDCQGERPAKCRT